MFFHLWFNFNIIQHMLSLIQFILLNFHDFYVILLLVQKKTRTDIEIIKYV